MDRNEFRKRMLDLKSYRLSNPDKGYWDWRNSLPDNLKYTDDTEYDMLAAYEAGVDAEYAEEDRSYHLPTRDPKTGYIFKKSIHPTFWKGLAEDAKLGYDAYFLGDKVYTKSKGEGPIKAFAEGGEVNDYDKQQQISNAITYALNRGNIDTAKSLMRRGTPDTNYYHPQSGAIDPVFSLYDTPVLGDAMITTDAARYAMSGDWANAGLAIAGLIIPGAIGKGVKKINRHIPSVKGYKEVIENLINRIMSPLDLLKQSDWNNMLYRSAELVYELDVIDRAAATGTIDRLNRVRDMYENNLENMPKIRMTDELKGARGRILLTKEAELRYKQGINPEDGDFEILVDKDIEPTQEVIDHEMRHWNQYMEQGSPNIDVTPTSQRAGVEPTKRNKLDPDNAKYYGKQGESEAYMLNVYRDMKKKGYTINFKNFKKYYNSLNSIDTKKRAISQFSSLDDAYKWMESMPLIGTAGVVAMNNKEQSN